MVVRTHLFKGNLAQKVIFFEKSINCICKFKKIFVSLCAFLQKRNIAKHWIPRSSG